MPATPALSTAELGAPLEATTIERSELGGRDVLIDIAYCGICHNDIHQVRNSGASRRTRWFPDTRSRESYPRWARE